MVLIHVENDTSFPKDTFVVQWLCNEVYKGNTERSCVQPRAVQHNLQHQIGARQVAETVVFKPQNKYS